jgi:L-ascorbate metabolism protein UlaG (beta-lactamase superfamily)
VSHHNASCDYLTAVQGPFKLLDGPGEYEISGVFITGVSTFADGERGRVRGLNTVFAFDFDGTTVCHLGRLGHVPTQAQVKNLGPVNVLLVPAGGGGSLTSTQASEVIGLFQPDVVVPMRYCVPGLHEDLDDVDHFLKEMGMEKVDGQETLRVSESTVLEETRIVLLEPVGNRQ